MNAPAKVLLGILLLAALSAAPPAVAQDETDDAEDQATESTSDSQSTVETDDQDEGDDDDDRPRDPRQALIEQLIAQVEQLRAEVSTLREQMAKANLEAELARRELAELQQFIQDNREYGDDFAQYQAIKEIAERDERIKRQQEARVRREDEMTRRRAERDIAAAQAQARAAEEEEMERYYRAGFEPLGLDVYIGRTGFFYHAEHNTSSRIEYEPIIGTFLEPIQTTRIDYSQMTISGSVLNTSDEIRNVGVAVAFFDRRGNQVGATTVQINNARPKVPYPFTALVQMALGEPFSSSSSWVLYADPIQ